jgi:hypothetical protein
MKANLKNFLKSNLGFNGGRIPGAKYLEDVVEDKTSGVINPTDSQSWFIDVLEDEMDITYNPWH